jgi:hypothetical protein
MKEIIITEWITWNGGECPIKSDKTQIYVAYSDGARDGPSIAGTWRWNWEYQGRGGDIIAYRIIEDHEPKMTREQITAQIEALQKQLDALPLVKRMWYDGRTCWAAPTTKSTHYFDIETINGVPYIHGVAMKKEVLK